MHGLYCSVCCLWRPKGKHGTPTSSCCALAPEFLVRISTIAKRLSHFHLLDILTQSIGLYYGFINTLCCLLVKVCDLTDSFNHDGRFSPVLPVSPWHQSAPFILSKQWANPASSATSQTRFASLCYVHGPCGSITTAVEVHDRRQLG